MEPFDTSSDSPHPPYGGLTNARILKFTCILILLLLLRNCFDSEEQPAEEPDSTATDSAIIQVEMAEPKPLGATYGPPTPQTLWQETDNPKVFMPTGSGRVQSAHYGSVRTQRSGRASFHEGVDIAPTVWSRGRAQDEIFAVNDGKVAYINRVGGNSSYGIYIVLEHEDPLGSVYTLYAHMASVTKSLRAGDPVQRGDSLGVMGHSSTLGIPRQRSHLHFELCLMLNPEFNRWYRSKKLTPNHQRYHGYNLVGLNPHFLLSQLHEREETRFSFEQALEQTQRAWTILIKTPRKPNYFSHYKDLWQGPAPQYGAIVLDVSESGVILAGRSASSEQSQELGTKKTMILDVDTEALGRNGVRHIQKISGKWQLRSNGDRWLEILLYRP